jgi:hypothetical protein
MFENNIHEKVWKPIVLEQQAVQTVSKIFPIPPPDSPFLVKLFKDRSRYAKINISFENVLRLVTYFSNTLSVYNISNLNSTSTKQSMLEYSIDVKRDVFTTNILVGSVTFLFSSRNGQYIVCRR